MIPRRTLGAAVIAVLPLTAACGAGRGSTTEKERTTPYVAQARAGSLFVTSAVLVPSQNATGASGSPTPAQTSPAPTSGSATPTPSTSSGSGSSGSGGADAYLAFTVLNTGTSPDQLTGVSLQGASVTPTDSSTKALTIKPQQTLRFGDPELGDSGNALQVSGLGQSLQDGTSMRVTFQFQSAGSVTIDVPVRAPDSYGTTSTSTPLPLTGSYPSASEEPKTLPTSG